MTNGITAQRTRYKTVKLSPDLHAKLKVAAMQCGMRLEALTCALIERGLPLLHEFDCLRPRKHVPRRPRKRR